jgi:hypothetical protein
MMRSLGIRLAAGGLAVAASLFGTSGRAVVAAGGPAEQLAPPAVPAPAVETAPVEAPAAPEPVAPAPAAGPDLTDPSKLPPINVENVSLTGEAYVVRGDLATLAGPLLGRFPHATTDVSKDLSTAFGAFADPGLAGRSMVSAATPPSGIRDAEAPAWAECVFPKSPRTPAEDTRSPAQGAGPSAAAICQRGAGRAVGYLVRDPGPGATAGVFVLGAAASAAAVEATSNAAGATAINSVSTMEDVRLTENVVIGSITNQVSLTTNGRPGGAKAETRAIIGGLRIGGQPVELPSDSIQDLGPLLAQLPPVVSPIGTLSFDVVPEQKEVATDGTTAAGRAAQLRVTVRNGQTTTSFALGFASARARTLVNQFTAPNLPSGVRRPGSTIPSPFGGAQPPYLRPVGGSSLGSFVDNMRSGGRFRPPPGGFVPSPPGGSGRNEAAISVLPPMVGGGMPQPTSQTSEPYGGSGPWLALMGGSVIGLALARYLAYARATATGAAS